MNSTRWDVNNPISSHKSSLIGRGPLIAQLQQDSNAFFGTEASPIGLFLLLRLLGRGHFPDAVDFHFESSVLGTDVRLKGRVRVGTQAPSKQQVLELPLNCKGLRLSIEVQELVGVRSEVIELVVSGLAKDQLMR